MDRGGQEIDPRLLPAGVAPQSFAPSYSRPSFPQDTPTRSGYAQTQQSYGEPARTSFDGMMSNGPDDEGSEGPYGSTHSPAKDDDAKRSRACDACRGLKVRCDQDSNNPDQPCKRCAKAGRQCIVTQPTRKRQKKADTRVADLEKKLDALTAALHAQQQGVPLGYDQSTSRHNTVNPDERYPHPEITSTNAPENRALPYTLGNYVYPQQNAPATTTTYPTMNAGQLSNKKRRLDDSLEPQHAFPSASNQYARPEPVSTVKDNKILTTLTKEETERLAQNGIRRELYHIAPEAIIARIKEIVDPALHEKIFNRFVYEMLPHLPMIIFPPGTKASEIMETKPYLFLCIIASASFGLVSEEAGVQLAAEVQNMFADCIIRASIKSLELVQSMLVSILWFRTAEKPDQANFYMSIHMAACMALDIGLGRKYQPLKSRRGFGGLAKNLPPGRLTALVDSDTVESRRTWLSCYYLCASASMSLRRPNLIRWSNYMQECVEFLERSPDAAPSDRLFISHVQVQKICEDIAVSFQMDDSSATSISISDPKVSYTLGIYEQKLKDWFDRLPADLREKPTLMFFHDTAILYLHEIAMHVNHNIDDFRLPFTEDTLKSGLNHSEQLTHKQMAALEACLGAAHRTISGYCSMSYDTVATLPTLLYFVRCIYSLVVLIKMHLAVTAPKSEVGKVIKPEDIKVEEYLDKLWNMMHGMNKHDLFKPHYKTLLILGILRDWFHAHKSAEANAEDTSQTKLSHSNSADSRLQVLSEAATGSHYRSNDQASSNWTLDTSAPSTRSRKNTASTGVSPLQPTASNTPTQSSYTGTGQTPPSYSSYMPGGSQTVDKTAYPFFGREEYNYGPGIVGGDLDWTADMNLEQVLDGAFRDFDMSGDLGGWFLGDGVASYHIPAEGAPPTTSEGMPKW